jgi:hypothetical protein
VVSSHNPSHRRNSSTRRGRLETGASGARLVSVAIGDPGYSGVTPPLVNRGPWTLRRRAGAYACTIGNGGVADGFLHQLRMAHSARVDQTRTLPDVQRLPGADG